MSTYIIYRILNLVTRKVYIGKTIRPLQKRWNEHKGAAKREDKTGCTYLNNSMNKYGVNNFEIRQIDEAFSPKHQTFLENFYIQYYQSFDSNYGYNLIVDNTGEDGLRILSDSTRLQKSISMCSIPRNQRKKGISWDKRRNKWMTKFKFLDDRVSKRFDSKVQAMTTYDRVSLFKLGDRAILYYPNNKEEYLSENLQEFYNKTITPRNRKARFAGVAPSSGNRFSSKICGVNGKNYIHLGIYDTEEEAAKIHDKVSLFLGRSKEKLNFKHEYSSDEILEGKAVYENFTNKKRQRNLREKKTSKYNGVSKSKTKNFWEMSYGTGRERIRERFLEEVMAAKAYDFYARKNNISEQWLNFPNEIITEKPKPLVYDNGKDNQSRHAIKIVETGEYFESIRDMIRKWGSCTQTISAALKDSSKTVKGVHLQRIFDTSLSDFSRKPNYEQQQP